MNRKVRDVLFDFVTILNHKVPCDTLDKYFDVALVIVFILAYVKHYSFIFSLSYNHFAHFLKCPNNKTIINNIFQNMFASFALILSKYLILCF